jgi:hypothetical protein
MIVFLFEILWALAVEYLTLHTSLDYPNRISYEIANSPSNCSRRRVKLDFVFLPLKILFQSVFGAFVNWKINSIEHGYAEQCDGEAAIQIYYSFLLSHLNNGPQIVSTCCG